MGCVSLGDVVDQVTQLTGIPADALVLMTAQGEQLLQEHLNSDTVTDAVNDAALSVFVFDRQLLDSCLPEQPPESPEESQALLKEAIVINPETIHTVADTPHLISTDSQGSFFVPLVTGH